MLDLITGHQGFLHITAEQISEVNRSITAGYGDNAVLRLKDGTLSSTGLSIGIAAGYWRANGFDVDITSADTIYVDPSSVGTSRIDKFYIELLQDIPSGNQRAELVYVKGTEASVPTPPDDPTAPVLSTDIMLECVCYATALIEENSLTLTDLTKVIQNVTPTDMELVKSWIRDNADVYSSIVTHSKGEIVLNALDGKVYECMSQCGAYSWEDNAEHFEERTIIDILDRINQQMPDVHKYGTCVTAASTTEKKVTTRLGDCTLELGRIVYVAFSYTNTAASPTLNVDNKGAKTIKGYGSTAPATWWQAGDKVQFIYDGVYWVMMPSQGQVSQLNNDLSFKQFGNYVAGTGSINISTLEYKELLFVLTYEQGPNCYIMTANTLKELIEAKSAFKALTLVGYGLTGTVGGVGFQIANKIVSLNFAYVGNTDIKSIAGTKFGIYYR